MTRETVTQHPAQEQTMTMTASIETQTQVECVHLSDGKLIRLAGSVGDDELSSLRDALLTPLPHGCRDVVVDAGDLTSITDDALAVLVAAPMWADTEGGRFFLSRSSAALDETLRDLGLVDLLPRLGPTMPKPRRSRD
jgi:anti-anti-sigma regulatory factor